MNACKQSVRVQSWCSLRSRHQAPARMHRTHIRNVCIEFTWTLHMQTNMRPFLESALQLAENRAFPFIIENVGDMHFRCIALTVCLWILHLTDRQNSKNDACSCRREYMRSTKHSPEWKKAMQCYCTWIFQVIHFVRCQCAIVFRFRNDYFMLAASQSSHSWQIMHVLYG